MPITFRKAERKQAKIRLALVAPSGYGKTFSALLIAKGLGGKVAVVDTENGSADLYADKFEFDVLTMNPPYDPEKYMMAIEAAEDAGYEILIIDSLSPAWGVLLERQSAIAGKTGNNFASWRDITPVHKKLLQKIIHSKIHIITTMRSKTVWVVDNGRPVKIGLAPEQRPGIDFEFTALLELDKDHNAHCSKDRTGLFDKKVTPMTENVGVEIKQWLEIGKPSQSEQPENQITKN